MKKIALRILLGLLIVVVVVGGTAAYMLFHNPNKGEETVTNNKPTMVDSSGDSHLVVVDGNGTSYAVVTDVDGNRFAAEYNGSVIGSTVGQINDQIAISDLPTKPTGEQVIVSNDPSAYVGEVGTTATTSPYDATTAYTDNSSPAGTTSAPVTSSPSGTSSDYVTDYIPQDTQPSVGPTNGAVNEPTPDTTVPSAKNPAPNDPNALVPYRIEKYQQIFASGNYLMEITTNDPDLGTTPITMAIKNGSMYIDTTIEGMNCQMLYMASNKTMYLMFTDWKKYCKLPEDLLGEDFDMSSMMADFGMEDIGEISVSQAEINGQTLILESYVSPVDGSTVNYYFNGDQLVRRDNISTSGVVDSIYVSTFLSDVPDSYFEIPTGYGYLNLSWLDTLM